jgi:hypothetical protein
MDDRQQFLDCIAALEAENADLRRRLGQMEHELQRVLQRGKRTRGARPSMGTTTPPRQVSPPQRRSRSLTSA